MIRLLVLAMVAVAAPASGQWAPANPEAAKAATNPKIAEVLAVLTRHDAAIVAGDKAGFMADFAVDAMVHNPSNRVATRAETERRFESGLIAYEYYRRSIEYAALRREDEVVLMGEEAYRPRAGAVHAGKTVRRRFTDVWCRQGARWLLSLRHATIVSVE